MFEPGADHLRGWLAAERTRRAPPVAADAHWQNALLAPPSEADFVRVCKWDREQKQRQKLGSECSTMHVIDIHRYCIKVL